MGDWYLINLNDILSLSDNYNLTTDSDGNLIPEYVCNNIERNGALKRYGIDKILVKQLDFLGNSFKELSTGIIIGNQKTAEPLVIDRAKKKLATNEEIIDYLNYMQEVVCVLVTRFDILNKLLFEYYDLCKPHSDIMKKIINKRTAGERNSHIIEFPILKDTSVENNLHNGKNEELRLLKGKQR